MSASVIATTASGYETRIAVRGHSLLADEPRELGGAAAGPTPVDLLLGALASCTTITARMYADRKGYRVNAIEARAERIDSGEPGPPTQIRLHIDIQGDLSEAERARIIEVAGRCPVHRAIEAGCCIEVA